MPSGFVACSSMSKPIHREDLRPCLRVVLGLDAADRRRLDAEPTTPSQPWPESRKLGRLLLAEDNLINQKVAVAMLTSAGYSVDTVLNGAEAVRAARRPALRRHPDGLPDARAERVRGHRRHPRPERCAGRTPIIAMTAGARREDQERCLAEGMDSYLSKPVSKDALLALVARSVIKDRR